MAMRRAEAFDAAPSTDDLDQLARAFAVARHLLGQIGEHAMQRLLESLQARVGGARDARRAGGLAGREHQQRVGGRGVAVDGHGVEGVGDAVLQQRLQRRRGDRARR